MLFCFHSQNKDLLQMNYWLDVEDACGELSINCLWDRC